MHPSKGWGGFTQTSQCMAIHTLQGGESLLYFPMKEKTTTKLTDAFVVEGLNGIVKAHVNCESQGILGSIFLLQNVNQPSASFSDLFISVQL